MCEGVHGDEGVRGLGDRYVEEGWLLGATEGSRVHARGRSHAREPAQPHETLPARDAHAAWLP